MSPCEAIAWCFRHFYHLDHSNAAIHCGDVRYSPITFRLAELARKHFYDEDFFGVEHLVAEVLKDRGAYEEDKGR